MWGTATPQRICSGEKLGAENVAMIITFIEYAHQSKNLKGYTKFDVTEPVFDVETVVASIFVNKKLDRSNLVLYENITRCMETLRVILILHQRLQSMRCESFNEANGQHLQLLETLWFSMMGKSRIASSVTSSEWLNLGFQGSDPTTDFRSMGMLGLYQLVYFANKKNDVAKLILCEFNKSGCVFPFAVIGINLSNLVMDMFVQRRLHKYIAQHFGNLTIDSSLAYLEGPSNDADCINYCIDLIHDVYCVAFEELYLVWVVRKPVSVMAFSDILKEVQEIMYDRYSAIRY
jgi:hypothetical protein